MAGIIYKPFPNNASKGAVFLVDTGRLGKKGAPTITANGQTYTGKYLNSENGIDQYEFPKEIRGMQDLQISYGGETGNLSSGSQAYEGDSISSFQPRARGSAGMFGAEQTGYAFNPAYLGDIFPNATKQQIAAYKYTDPLKFAQQFGNYNRNQYQQNFKQASQNSLDTINNELKSLQSFVPAAAALQRETVSADNAFNQAQRSAQVNAALPGVNQQLAAQSKRAESYASGNLPDSMMNNALELGIRSQAADRATAGGFGATSSVARKASDLMSAQQRFQIGQYGEGLLGSNINAKASLNLAPTEYANAGSQVRVMPSLSASQLTQAGQNELNQYSMISPTNALQTEVNQQQFRTNQVQGVNAYNAQTANQFALDKFNYQVGYANTVAGAAQMNSNIGLELQQQAIATEIAKQQMANTQRNNLIQSGIQAVGTAYPIVDRILKAINGGGGSSFTSPDIGTPEDILGPGSILSGNIPDFSVPSTDITSGSSIPGADTIASTGSVPEFSNTGSDLSFGADLSLGNFQTYASQVPTDVARSLISSPVAKSMSSDLNLPAPASISLAALPAGTAQNITAGTLANAGLSTKAEPGYVPAGVNFQGQQVYADPKLAADNSFTPGVQAVAGLSNTLSGLDIPTLPKDKLTSIANVASDDKLVRTLDNHIAENNTEGFVNTIMKAFGEPSADKITPKRGADVALAAYTTAQHWPEMSNGQKSLALSSIGTQAIKGTNGKPLSQLTIPATSKDGVRPLTVTGAIKLSKAGYAPKEVSYHWGDLSNLQKALGGTVSAIDFAKLGESAGAISKASSTQQIDPMAGMGASAMQLAKGWGNAV